MLALCVATAAFAPRAPLALARSNSHSARAAVQLSGAYDFSAKDLESNKLVELSQYEGQVSLVVNVASK